MKQFILAIALVLATCFAQAQEQEKPQLQLHDFTEASSVGGMANLLTLFNEKNWPDDDNGKPCALIRVRFENMTTADAENVQFALGNTSGLSKKENRLSNQDLPEMWLFVGSANNTFLEAQFGTYGKSNRLSGLKLKEKGVYDVVLTNNKTVTISIVAKPEGTTSRLADTGQLSTLDGTITNVALGRHELEISKDGQLLKKETIEVSESNVKFEYDLRPRKKVRFVSDPSNATIYIDDKVVGRTPATIELAYDSYDVRAQLSPEEIDSRSITVSNFSADEIKLEPIKKKAFEVYAIYNGKKVDADLYIDNKQEGTSQSSYSLELPIGKKYDMLMTYFGNSKRRKIKVTSSMNAEQEFKISARNAFVWPWQREYDSAPMGFAVGYVSKQLVTQGNGEKLKENGVWDDGQNKSLSGMQFGLHFQPCLSFGLGFYTGLFYEIYMSWNDNYDYTEFIEHCLYVPVHGYYRLPFGRKIALSIHGGLGFNYSVHGAYSDKNDEYEDYTDFYGQEYFPKRFNMAAEIGAGLRFGPVQINAQYAKGLTNHKSYASLGDYKTIQNKLTLSVSYVFGTGL